MNGNVDETMRHKLINLIVKIIARRISRRGANNSHGLMMRGSRGHEHSSLAMSLH